MSSPAHGSPTRKVPSFIGAISLSAVHKLQASLLCLSARLDINALVEAGLSLMAQLSNTDSCPAFTADQLSRAHAQQEPPQRQTVPLCDCAFIVPVPARHRTSLLLT